MGEKGSLPAVRRARAWMRGICCRFYKTCAFQEYFKLKNLSVLVNAIRKRILLSLFIDAAFKFAAPSAIALTGLALIDYLSSSSLPVKAIVFTLAPAWAVFCAYGFARAVAGGAASDGAILALLGREHPELKDGLISAWQLSKKIPPGVSEELTALLTEQMEKAALGIDAARSYKLVSALSARFLRAFAVFAAIGILLYIVPPGILRPALANMAGRLSGSGWPEWFDVSPGSKELPWGSPVEITAAAKGEMSGRPVLLIRSEDGGWSHEDMILKGPKAFGYTIDKLAAKIGYRVRWAQFTTREFTLSPVTAPQLGGFTLVYSYPEYTGMGQRSVSGNPEVSAISGTRITVTARSTKKIKSAGINTSWKSDAAVKYSGYAVSAAFTVTKDGAYSLKVTAEDGSYDPEPGQYAVKVIADRPPLVELLSPSGDLIAAENAEIPLVVHVEDDFGVTKVELAYKNGTGGDKRIIIGSFGKGIDRKDIEYDWKLSGAEAKPGDRITYYVEAWDNDMLGGPKSAVSATQSVEINDYLKEHEKIENSLKDVRDDLLGLLADQNAARKKLKELEVAFSTAALNDAQSMQSKIKDNVKTPLEKLGKSLTAMENDPYCDFATYGEYRGLNSHLEYLRDNQMPAAVDSLKNKDLPGAAKNQDEIIAALEKMALLSEDIWQYQKMKDLFNTGEDLKRASADLREQLGLNPQGEKLKSQLKKLEDMLDKINKQLSKLPHELPEDFVNSPAIKKVDMASFGDTLSKMRDAVSRGDWKRAQELADEFQKSIESLLSDFDSAGADIGFSKDQDEKLAKQVQDYGSRLDGLIEDQRSWLEKTRQADEARRRALFAEQEKTLLDLYEKQKALGVRAGAIKKELSAGFGGVAAYTVEHSMNLMGKVLEEFGNKRAFNSQKYLGDIIADWKETRAAARGFSHPSSEDRRAGVLESVDTVVKGEEVILDTLKKGGNASGPAGADAAKYDNLSKEETALSSKTFGLHKDMQDFIRKSTAVGPEAFGNLSRAGEEMNDAAGKMGKNDPGQAAGSGQKALELLEQGRDGLNEAQGKLGDMQGKSGNKVSGAVQARSGGTYGFRNAAVKLPGKDEYKPPKEFRQEIMEALKEKYPQKYEKMIKEYYRRLTE